MYSNINHPIHRHGQPKPSKKMATHIFSGPWTGMQILEEDSSWALTLSFSEYNSVMYNVNVIISEVEPGTQI